MARATAIGRDGCAWCIRNVVNLEVGGPPGYHRTYTLGQCVWPSELGVIPGCPRCNTVEHGFEDCPERQQMTEEERRLHDYTSLVRNRSDLPPIRTRLSWAQSAVDSEVTFPGYPATKEFVRARLAADKGPFIRFHQEKPRCLLDDPATASLDVIRQNLASLSASEPHPRPVSRIVRVGPRSDELRQEATKLQRTDA